MVFDGRASLVPSLKYRGVGVDAAIAQERPISARFLYACGIAFDDQNFFLVSGRFREDAAKRIGDKGMTPKFQPAFG
jgi:hypothetical protein